VREFPEHFDLIYPNSRVYLFVACAVISAMMSVHNASTASMQALRLFLMMLYWRLYSVIRQGRMPRI